MKVNFTLQKRTNALKRLESIFAKKDENDFDHKNISKTEVKQIQSKMEENFDLFQKLHLRCCELRPADPDEAKEEENLLKDEEYS